LVPDSALAQTAPTSLNFHYQPTSDRYSLESRQSELWCAHRLHPQQEWGSIGRLIRLMVDRTRTGPKPRPCPNYGEPRDSNHLRTHQLQPGKGQILLAHL